MTAYGLDYGSMTALVTTGGALPVTPRASDDTYDALNPKGRRRTANSSHKLPEDWLLNSSRRDQLDANALDVQRNMSLLGWMIRRTLDFCCLWDFHPQTRDDGLNKDLRELMERDCQAGNIDYVGRMSWDDMRRCAEAGRILVGDQFFVPLREGTLQMLEGTLCRDPFSAESVGGGWINGARLNSRGRVMEWNFRSVKLDERYSQQFQDKQIKANNVWQYIQYDGRPGIIRGVSPIISALNELRDIYETMDLARAKVKLEQLFGIAIFENKDEDDDIGNIVDESGTEEDTDPETKEEHADFGNGPVVLRRTVGEQVEILQADSPGSNTQEFLRLCIQLTLLALDLPANFWNPSETNFFGSRAAWNLFERSCHARRQTQLRLHHRMTRWRYNRWTFPQAYGGTGEIVLPRGMSVNDLIYRWVPRGVPWWKPQEELHAGLQEVAAGLGTFQGLCDKHGLGLWEHNIETIAREIEKARQQGLMIQFNSARLDCLIATATQKGGAA